MDEDIQVLVGELDMELLLLVMGFLEWCLVMICLVMVWKGVLCCDVLDLCLDDLIGVFVLIVDVVWLVGDLFVLMDEVEIEEVDWNVLLGFVLDGYICYWQIMFDFLKIVWEVWLVYLVEQGKMDLKVCRLDFICCEVVCLWDNLF